MQGVEHRLERPKVQEERVLPKVMKDCVVFRRIGQQSGKGQQQAWFARVTCQLKGIVDVNFEVFTEIVYQMQMVLIDSNLQ